MKCLDGTCGNASLGKWANGSCWTCWLKLNSPSRYEATRSVRAQAAASMGVASASPDEPSLFRKVRNFAGAVVRHAATGFAQADEAEVARRRAICEECPELLANDTCRLCGCPKIRKTAWASSECPIKKW